MQCIDTRRNRQLSAAVQCGQPITGDAKFVFQIELPASTRQLDDVSHIVDSLERRSTVVTLDQPRDVLFEHRLAQARGNEIDELLTPEEASNVRVIEDALGPGQTECRTSYHNRKAGGRAVAALMKLPTFLENINEEA